MKNLIVVFIIVIGQNLFGQVLPAFPNNFVEMEIKHTVVDDGSSPPEIVNWYSLMAYKASADDTVMTLDNGNNVLGFIYMDSVHVWFMRTSETTIPGESSSEFVLNQWSLVYDYSMVVGDTAYMENLGIGPFSPVIVDSITIELLDGSVDQKHFHLSNDDKIIEKVGSINGFFSPFDSHFESHSSLCGYLGNYEEPIAEFIYYSPPANTCNFSNVAVGQLEELKTNIVPNPFSEQLSITSNHLMQQIEICDLSGRLIQRFDHLNSAFLSIDPEDLCSGAYILKVTDVMGGVGTTTIIRE